MKRWKGITGSGRLRAAACILAGAILCAGCGAEDAGYESGFGGYGPEAVGDSYDSIDADYSFNGDEYYDFGGGVYEEAVREPGSAAETGVQNIRSARKLIETVTLEVETKEFEQMMSALELQIQSLGGYIESMNTYNGSRYSGRSGSRYADMTIRIPQQEMKGFLETVSEAGNIVRRSDKVEDVTLSYVDMESRRNTLRTEQERLLAFLDRAETVEEIIALEERLSNVRYQLESMESQLRTIDNLVDYSTVYLNVSEVQELTPVEEPTVWERVRDGFDDSLYHIWNSALELGIWFVVHIPYILLWGALLAAVILILRGRRRKRLKGKEADKSKPDGE